jgi:hypothetical protein
VAVHDFPVTIGGRAACLAPIAETDPGHLRIHPNQKVTSFPTVPQRQDCILSAVHGSPNPFGSFHEKGSGAKWLPLILRGTEKIFAAMAIGYPDVAFHNKIPNRGAQVQWNSSRS